MRSIILSIILVMFGVNAAVAASPDSPTIGIVAVVDDQVVSSIDLNDRIALVMGTTGIPDTPENRAHILPQILHQLIDEKLQMEEASRLSIVISDAKLQEGIARVEQQSGRGPGSLERYLQDKGLSKQSFFAQVRAQMAWSEIVLKKIRPRIHISDQEVARYVKRKEASPSSAKEVLIATIQLPVDAPASETNVKKLADKLAGEIRSGASFEAVASQFSSGTGGTKAADPFWVELSQVDPVIGGALSKTGKGGITDPLRTATGYQIVKFIDERQAQTAPVTKEITEEPVAELAFKEILMTLKPDAERKEAELLLQLAKEAAAAPGKCEEKTMAGVGDLAALDFKVSFIRNVSNQMSDKLRDLLMKLKVGSVSEPVVTPQGVRLFMLCERIDLPPAKVPASIADEAVRQSIYKEKLELEAEKYLRNLRREAFVEIRARG